MSLSLQGTVRSKAGRRLRIGIIAAEIFDGYGGMQEHARGLVANLAIDHEVSVYTSHGSSSQQPLDAEAVVHPVLRWTISHDLSILESANVDAWITLNAGLASYSPHLSAPTFAYIHGNDFTRPWLPHPERQIRLARKVLGEGVVHRWRAARISAGLRAARWVFANSAFSRGLCSRMHGIPEAQISIVPPGMRPEFFRASDPAPDHRLRLVTVSRLSANAERKNIDGVIEAVALLKDEIDIVYTIIGEGDDLPRLRALAQTLGISKHVHFLGAVDTTRIIEEFCRSDAFIMAVKHSDIDVEGFGMVYAEAAATGLPSIGAKSGGIPEVIENGVTGLLLDDVAAGGVADGLRKFNASRSGFDRNTIRMKASRFAAPHCAAMIAETINAKLA